MVFNAYLRFTVIFYVIFVCDSAKILFVCAPTVDSHHRAMYPLARKLSQRGHNVTILMERIAGMEEIPTKNNNPSLPRNYFPLINDSKLVDAKEEGLAEFVWKTSHTNPKLVLLAWDLYGSVSAEFAKLRKDQFQSLVQEKWDFVIIDTLFSLGGMIIAWASNSTWANFHVVTPSFAEIWLKALPYPIPYVPPLLMFEPRFEAARFWDRLFTVRNDFMEVFWSYFIKFPDALVQFNTHNKVVSLNTFFGESKFSLIAYSQYLDVARPVTTNLIYFGGFDEEISYQLDGRELKTFIEDSRSSGTILLAFGHMIKWSTAPENLKNSVISAINGLSQYRIIWQTEDSTPKLGLGGHVRCYRWLPQQALLNHPNTKLFVTHGGFKSVSEAISAQVPMLVIPFFYDQMRTSFLLKKAKVAQVIQKFELTPENLRRSMEDILSNADYKKSLEKFSTSTMDALVPRLDQAAFWVEFFIRHKNRSNNWFILKQHRLRMYQFFLIDVVALFLAVSCFLVILFFKFYSIILHCVNIIRKIFNVRHYSR